MNQKRLILAVVQGGIFGFLMFQWCAPKDEVFLLRADSSGGYARALDEKDYQLKVREVDAGELLILYEPKVDWVLYFMAIFFAFTAGMTHYQALGRVRGDEIGDPFSSESTSYEEFLKEDENRRLFPKHMLEEEFQKWESGRSDDEAAK